MSVKAPSDGAEVVWASEFTAASPQEAGLAAAIGDIYRSSLAELEDRLES